ncbi:hypothetical protein BU26DRAFT_514002, partial [Trematosphaeria pertusa]
MSQSFQTSLYSIWAAVHSPSGLPFPTTVARLTSLGITRYRVDYVARTITAYRPSPVQPTSDPPTSSSAAALPSFAADTAPFPTAHLYALGSWDKEGVVKAIRRAQAGEGNYIEFSEAVVAAGVTDYTCYIEGKNVVYAGEKGEMHVEWFPGAGPGKD